MNVIRQIVQVITDRTIAVAGSLFAARLETMAVMEQAEQKNELEERARQLDEQGKPQLADALRARAAEINPDVPAALGLRVLRNLQDEHDPVGPMLLECPDEDDNNKVTDESEVSTRPRRRRSTRTTRRSCPKD